MVNPSVYLLPRLAINIDLLSLSLIYISTLPSIFQYISKLIADMNTFFLNNSGCISLTRVQYLFMVVNAQFPCNEMHDY